MGSSLQSPLVSAEGQDLGSKKALPVRTSYNESCGVVSRLGRPEPVLRCESSEQVDIWRKHEDGRPPMLCLTHRFIAAVTLS